MKGDKKVSGYVKRYFKHRDLAAKYQERVDRLLPLKRKVDAAAVDMKVKRQTLTGGEWHRATTEIVKRLKAEDREVPAEVEEERLRAAEALPFKG